MLLRLLLLFFITLSICPSPSGASNLIYPSVNMKAPDFILESTSGEKVRFSDYVGKDILILNFWAFWCDTWQGEADGFYSLKKDFSGISYKILSLSIDGQLDLLLSKKSNLIYYPVLLDIKSQVSKKYGIDNVPTLFIIDRDGIIRYKFRGYPGTRQLYMSIKHLMDEVKKEPLNKTITLTFDDFPVGDNSNLLLDILKEENIKVTFFVIGEKAKKYPDIIKKAFLDGHQIEIHCFYHRSFSGLSEEEIRKEIFDTSELLYLLTGKVPEFLRAPGGYSSHLIETIAFSYGLTILNWTINPFDYQRPGEQILAERILGELKKDKEILLLHDGVEETRAILPELISIIKGKGYKFVQPDGILK